MEEPGAALLPAMDTLGGGENFIGAGEIEDLHVVERQDAYAVHDAFLVNESRPILEGQGMMRQAAAAGQDADRKGHDAGAPAMMMAAGIPAGRFRLEFRDQNSLLTS
jgi:hypothetical protein